MLPLTPEVCACVYVCAPLPVPLEPPPAQLGEANSQREEMVGLLGGYQRSIQELQVGGARKLLLRALCVTNFPWRS